GRRRWNEVRKGNGMTQIEPQTSGDPEPAAARRGWQPSALRAAQSMVASARGFGAGTVARLLAWHGRMSRWDEGMGAPRRAATAARRVEVQGAPLPELPTLLYREPPPIRGAALPTAAREAAPPVEPTIKPRLQTLTALPKEAPTAPRLGVSAGRQDPAAAKRFVVLPSLPAARP